MNIGDVVFDDLTGNKVKIIAIQISEPIYSRDIKVIKLSDVTYKVNDPYLEGQRYPWELSEVGE